MRAAESRRGLIFDNPKDQTIGAGVRFLDDTIAFDGSASGVIKCGDLLRRNLSAITMSCWVKYKTAGDTTNRSLMGQAVAGLYRTELFTNTGDLFFYACIDGVGRYAQCLSAVVTDGEWHHVAGTWESGSYVRIYVDGELQASSAATHSGSIVVSDSVKDFAIGAWYNGGQPFPGQMRSPNVFSTALSADEINAYYEKSMFHYSPISSYYMRMADHDSVNVRTLDVHSDNHMTFGDGSTSSTYPTKQTGYDGYTFDGTTDYLESRDSVGFSSCAFAALVKFDAVSLRTIISHGSTGDLFLLGCGVQGGVGTDTELYFSMFSGSWKRAGSFSPNTGIIYSVIGTFDGTTLTLYVNGENKGTNTAAPDTREFPLRIGRRWDAANPNYFDGTVYEAHVFDTCLNPIQVLDLHQRMMEGKHE